MSKKNCISCVINNKNKCQFCKSFPRPKQIKKAHQLKKIHKKYNTTCNFVGRRIIDDLEYLLKHLDKSNNHVKANSLDRLIDSWYLLRDLPKRSHKIVLDNSLPDWVRDTAAYAIQVFVYKPALEDLKLLSKNLPNGTFKDRVDDAIVAIERN